MKTTHLYTLIAYGAFALLLFVGNARAESSADALAAVQFPVAELGSCDSKEACKAYCDESEHMEACISFAEKNGLMPAEEIQMAKKFIAAGGKGPGDCTGKDSCEAYCNDMAHIDACVAFAEENGMMSGDELAEAKKVQAAIRSGVKPPACGSKKACDAYCESADHMSECIAFAKAAGLMSAEEQANADKMLRAIQSGAKPPACRGKEECDAYCSDEAHFSECLEFGKAAGFMTDAEYEMAKKTGGKGPGGCRGKEKCDAFCTSSAENEELCINFQVEKGIMSEERKNQMEKDKEQFRESFSNMPPEVAQCLSDAWGAENFEKLRAGTMRPSRWTGDAMPKCFGQFEQQRMQNDRPSGPPPGGDQQYSGPRPEDRQYGPSPEGWYPPPCEGENCRPPEGFAPPEGQQYGPPPEGNYPPPCEGENCQPAGPYPMPYGEGGQPPMREGAPLPEGGTYDGSQGAFTPPSGEQQAPMTEPAPTETAAPEQSEPSAEPAAGTAESAPVQETAVAPAPAPESAPAPAETITVSTDSLAGAVVLFLKAFGL